MESDLTPFLFWLGDEVAVSEPAPQAAMEPDRSGPIFFQTISEGPVARRARIAEPVPAD